MLETLAIGNYRSLRELVAPLGPMTVITGANANDGQQAANVLEALVIKPPTPQIMNATPDPRDLPSARGD